MLYSTGVWVQHNFCGLLETFAAIPIVGITEFSIYALAGSLLLGPIVGLALGASLAKAVVTFRKNMLRLEEGSERFRRWRDKGWVRFLDRLLIGKSARSIRDVLQRRPRFVRIPGVAFAVLLLVGAGVGAHYFQKTALADVAGRQLTFANGAEVNFKELQLSVAQGRLSGSGIEMTDPAKPTHNRIAIGTISADVNWYGLSTGRVIMDEVELSAVETDSPRSKPGAVLDRPKKDESSNSAFDFSGLNLKDVDPKAIETYCNNAKQIREWLKNVQEYLPGKKARLEKDTKSPEAYLAYLTARAQASPTPRFIIHRLVLNDIAVPVDQIGKSDIVCMNLSEAPSALSDPLTIDVKSKEKASSVKITCDYTGSDPAAKIEATLEKIDLAKLQRDLKSNNPVIFEGGTATAHVSGKAGHDFIDLAIGIKTNGMKARTAGSSGALGLDPKVTSEAMKVLENIETTLRLVGPTHQSAPRL
ncbi:MAG: hypothetical protein IPK83_10400 [Planctomycetes bacterium]|nr:hypothetical protein [Planctomycetota bacterium]